MYSKSFQSLGGNKYKLTGDLTIRDITKEVEFQVTYGGQIVDPYGFTRVGFKVTGVINRFDFDLKWNALLETGSAMVGKNVKINCDLELTRK